MVESNALGENTKIDIQFYSDMEAMMALASEGKYGVIVTPAYTAANLYNKGINVEIMNLYNWGGMFLSTTDTNCNSWEELAGKELYVPAKGSVPDILTQFF
jgi:NitT/TauT family transport system substrate-binding protein